VDGQARYRSPTTREVWPLVKVGVSGWRNRNGEDGNRGEAGEGDGKVRVVIPSSMCRNPVKLELMMTVGKPILRMSVIQNPP
jgi:hypothetical protein